MVVGYKYFNQPICSTTIVINSNGHALSKKTPVRFFVIMLYMNTSESAATIQPITREKVASGVMKNPGKLPVSNPSAALDKQSPVMPISSGLLI